MCLLNTTNFALECGVSKAAITKAHDRGEIVRDDDGNYDINHPDNAAYILRQMQRQSEAGHKKIEKQKAPAAPKKRGRPKGSTKPKPEPEAPAEPKKRGRPKGTTKSKKEPQEKLEPKKPGKPKKPVVHMPTQQPISRGAGFTKAEKDLELLDIKIKTAEVNYEKLVEGVVERQAIQHIWNKIYKSASYFADFGQRYAGEWAAALGISEPEKVLELEKEIDKATEAFMYDFTEQVAAEII